MSQIAYPWRLGGDGRTASCDDDRHVRDLIEQVLFTTPGERVNRPTFGSGVLQLAFAPLSDELTATSQVLVQAALQQWLGDLIQVEAVAVDRDESKLQVTIQYLIRRTTARVVDTFVRET